MKKDLKVLILGKGNVGRAVACYLRKLKATKKVAFFTDEKKVKNFDVLIGALPSQVGKKGLELALKYKKDLIDISAAPVNFYLKHKKEIQKKGIRVVPGCGVSPGLVNLIAGFGSGNFEKIKEIEISAGTLPWKIKHFFPFTWCFEDLVEEHLYRASVIKNGKKISLPPFSGYEKGKLKEVGEYETYLTEEWNTLFYSIKPKNISFRVIRPVGFYYFFQYLKNHGFFKEENIPFAKDLLTKKKEDNITLILVKIKGKEGKKEKEIVWQAFSFAKKGEKLNSMQKITAIVPAVIFRLITKDKIKNRGIIYMEDLGKDKKLFREIIEEIKNDKSILVKSKING
ncbi:MAG: saccharopine dehydrogenase C-terminal domain-containing protein [Candidatus Pacebacteria bacterium]|nr:saccharopine dehydrogenase C-terminal domain-containing protein [Candidatus Paceibacterota bacterium]